MLNLNNYFLVNKNFTCNFSTSYPLTFKRFHIGFMKFCNRFCRCLIVKKILEKNINFIREFASNMHIYLQYFSEINTINKRNLTLENSALLGDRLASPHVNYPMVHLGSHSQRSYNMYIIN